MDRQLSNKTKQRKKIKLAIRAFGVITIFLLVIFILRIALKPSIKAEKLNFAIVEIGNLEATVNASGTIVPEFEEIMISPVQSQIMKIYRNVGSRFIFNSIRWDQTI